MCLLPMRCHEMSRVCVLQSCTQTWREAKLVSAAGEKRFVFCFLRKKERALAFQRSGTFSESRGARPSPDAPDTLALDQFVL